jgi:anaerobic magnesium-protoporphyrin IX monomethyl ester cyclase
MRIALINPPFKAEYGRFSRTSRGPAIAKSGTLYYPMWLAYACGFLEKNGHEVLLLDCCADRLDLETTAARVEAFTPQLLVLDTSTPSIAEDVRSAVRLKHTKSSPFICLVGTHPTVLPEDVLALSPEIDCIARREYDATLVELAACLQNKKDLTTVAGISFRQDGVVVHNPDRAFVEDLDAIPFASEVYKKHLNVNNYFFAAGQYPMVMIITGRGCPSRCFFCLYPQTFHGHKYRLRSAQNVVDEFEYVARELPKVKSVGIEDDTFTANPARVKEICRLLIERGLHKKLNWWANTRVTLDLEMMSLMKQAGCRLIIPGFESGDQSILKNINKGITLEQSRRYVRAAQQSGLLVHGCYMVGNKGETRQTMQKTLDFALETNPDTAQFLPLIPYPGTEAFQWAKENGYLSTNDFSKWVTEDGLHQCVVNLPDIPSSELVAFCDHARRKYYFRPLYLLRKLNQALWSSQERRRTLKSFRQFWKFLFNLNSAPKNAKAASSCVDAALPQQPLDSRTTT